MNWDYKGWHKLNEKQNNIDVDNNDNDNDNYFDNLPNELERNKLYLMMIYHIKNVVKWNIICNISWMTKMI